MNLTIDFGLAHSGEYESSLSEYRAETGLLFPELLPASLLGEKLSFDENNAVDELSDPVPSNDAVVLDSKEGRLSVNR